MDASEIFAIPWFWIAFGLFGIYALLLLLAAVFPRGGRRLNRTVRQAPKETPERIRNQVGNPRIPCFESFVSPRERP